MAGNERRKAVTASMGRSFSVIVPTYERPDLVARCVAGLARIDFPRDRFEVLVVDDGGRVPLGEILAPWQADLDLSILRIRHSGPAVARNHGARHASGAVLAFLDDDCVPRTSWLSALSVSYNVAPETAVGGRVVNELTSNRCAVTSQILVDYLRNSYGEGPDTTRFLTSNNLSFPADGFWEVGGFDERFPRPGAEDRELCDRWVQSGRILRYAAGAIVDHAHDLSLAGFCRQHLAYGRGAFYYHRIRAASRAGRPRFEPLSFYLGLMRAPGWAGMQAGVTLLMGLSQVVNASGYFLEAVVARLKDSRPAQGPT